MTPVYINGRFLGKPITGTQRFAREIISSLDLLISQKNGLPPFTLIAPTGIPAPSDLKTISFEEYGTKHGHLWEQSDLVKRTKNGFLINLTNSGPVCHPHQLTVIHDALVFRHPENYSIAYGLFHRFLGRLLSRKSAIATVSSFSREELASTLSLQPEEIQVITNGCEHLAKSVPDDAVLSKLGLTQHDFFLFVGSPSPSKNLQQAVRAFSTLSKPNVKFLIVGGVNKSIFAGIDDLKAENIILAGRLSDSEIVSLYQNAAALVFPSLYEGFGIPPLEAMVQQCPVLASNIPPVKEVCSDAALYFDPLEATEIRDRMEQILANVPLRRQLINCGNQRVRMFSWRNSAKKLLDIILERIAPIPPSH